MKRCWLIAQHKQWIYRYHLRMDRTQRLQIFAKTVKLMLFQALCTKPNLAPRPITWKLYLVTLELGGALCQPSNSGNNKIVPSKYLSDNMYIYTYQGVRSKANPSADCEDHVPALWGQTIDKMVFPSFPLLHLPMELQLKMRKILSPNLI